jgi:hypothetical protein
MALKFFHNGGVALAIDCEIENGVEAGRTRQGNAQVAACN